ncbi:MAG: DUF429 domain-containing protein [Planctomycetes bacterium]|nr:DUF429 domain-containing protein [Planctomycetota bacterium]
MRVPEFATVCGVDFSGARLAGRNIWVARAECRARGRLALVALDPLAALCGTAARAPCLAALVQLVRDSDAALWGFDCPFGLPLDLFPPGATWADQFAFVDQYGDDEAYQCGLDCVARTTRLPPGPLRSALHCRRQTDADAKAPFDAFHYRMIYQTFFGLRDVVRPLAAAPGTAVLPFQYRKLPRAKRVLVECCPASVLKRYGLPHQNYKQPKGGPLARVRRHTRHAILAQLGTWVALGDRHTRAVMRNPGGDALDAVLAAAGALRGFRAADHATIARHPRFPREGYMYL